MKGIYVLLISVSEDANVNVGALGIKNFQKGKYVYVGSAQNSLEKRVERHFKAVKPLFWHIDYLLASPAARIVNGFYKEAGRQDECMLAKRLAKNMTLVKGFGSSDCSCAAHLFKVHKPAILKRFLCQLGMRPLERSSCLKRAGVFG
jgi:Uri superfamily endonuclease